MAVDILEELD